MRRLYILRPEPGASDTARRARAMGLDAVPAPLFRIEPAEWASPGADGFDALLLTSANAVRHGGPQLEQLRGLPVHAVGEATAEAAREAGFAIAGSGEAGVDRLLGSIEADVRLLHLTGEDRRAPKDARQAIIVIPVYRAVPLSPDLSGIAGEVAAVHSPRVAQRLAQLLGEEQRKTVRLAAISRAAAEAAGGGWAEVGHAAAPTDSAVLALAARLCEKSGQE